MGTKIVGDTKESIGISLDGKVHFSDDAGTSRQIPVNCVQGQTQAFQLKPNFILGVGYIFKTKQVLFTANGKEVDLRDLP